MRWCCTESRPLKEAIILSGPVQIASQATNSCISHAYGCPTCCSASPPFHGGGYGLGAGVATGAVAAPALQQLRRGADTAADADGVPSCETGSVRVHRRLGPTPAGVIVRSQRQSRTRTLAVALLTSRVIGERPQRCRGVNRAANRIHASEQCVKQRSWDGPDASASLHGAYSRRWCQVLYITSRCFEMSGTYTVTLWITIDQRLSSRPVSYQCDCQNKRAAWFRLTC